MTPLPPPSHRAPEPPKHFSLGTAKLPAAAPTSFFRAVVTLPWQRILGIGGLMLLAGLIALLVPSVRLTQALQFDNKPISFFEGIRQVGAGLFSSQPVLKGEAEGRTNILLLGRAGEGKPGRDLTDTIMLLSLDYQKKQVALISLPRDLLVPVAETNTVAKINTLYQYGLARGAGANVLKASVQEITGLPIHYFASIDFDGFEKVIDALGGITVDIIRDIHDTRYPGPNYSYETFDIRQGWQKLDGQTALKYARVRHGDPEGDFGRAKRQQQILQAVREKAWSLPTFLNPVTLTQLFESLGASVTTDITPEDGRRLLELGETLDTKNISTVVVDAWKKESLLRVTHVEAGGVRAFALVPRSGTWQEVQSLAQQVFEVNSFEARQQAVAREKASLLILTAPSRLPTAESLKQEMLELFPVQSVTLRVIPALEKKRETAIIQSLDGDKKIYTLDSLISRYNLEYTETLDVILPTTLPPADFIILYTKEIIPGLRFETPPTGESEDFQEPLPLLPRSTQVNFE